MSKYEFSLILASKTAMGRYSRISQSIMFFEESLNTGTYTISDHKGKERNRKRQEKLIMPRTSLPPIDPEQAQTVYKKYHYHHI